MYSSAYATNTYKNYFYTFRINQSTFTYGERKTERPNFYGMFSQSLPISAALPYWRWSFHNAMQSHTACTLYVAKKSAKIILIFLKSTRGLHKNAHFFPIFLNVEYSYSLIFFPLIDGRVRSRAIFALAGWLPLFLDDNVVDAILERVWWTGFLEGNRWPIKPIPQASSAPLTKMRAKCGFRRH